MDANNPFRDWLESYPYSGTWVPVGRLGGWLGPASLPVLFEAGEKEKMLASADWPLRVDAGPEVWEYDGERSAELHPARDRAGVPIEPLAVYFNPPDRPSWLEPVQACLQYLNAAPRHQQGSRISWEIRDEDGRPEEIARWQPIEAEERGGMLEIRRDQLFAFLYDFNFDLAIFFEENRAVTGVEDGWREEGRESNRYWKALATDSGLSETRGLLRAVTVLERPTSAPPTPDHSGQTLAYIIGTDPETGQPIRDSYPGKPNEKTTWGGVGDDNFLTPVFFRREVLNEYLADPLHYEVTETQVSAGGMWSIRIALTERGNVQVWLGDLGLISNRAQQHWQRFNIADDDELPDWRRRRDLNAEWVETPRDEPLDQLRDAIERCNQAALAYCGKPFYAEVTGLNAQRVRTLHKPLNSSEPAFQHQVTTLAILVVDHINSEFFKAVEAREGQGLNRLANWIAETQKIELDKAKEIIGGLYAVLAIRSSAGGAHRAGERAMSTLERSKIDPSDLPAGFDSLVRSATASIERLGEILRGLQPRPRFPS